MRISHKQGMATTLATQAVWGMQPGVTPMTDTYSHPEFPKYLSFGVVAGVSGQVQAGWSLGTDSGPGHIVPKAQFPLSLVTLTCLFLYFLPSLLPPSATEGRFVPYSQKSLLFYRGFCFQHSTAKNLSFFSLMSAGFSPS